MACLLSTELALNPRHHIEPSRVHTCNPSIKEVDAGRSRVHSQLHSEFKVSLGYMKPYIHRGQILLDAWLGDREGKQDDMEMELKTGEARKEWLGSHRHLSQVLCVGRVLTCLDFPPVL